MTRGGGPDVLDGPEALDVGKDVRGAGGHLEGRGDLPALAQVTGMRRPAPRGGHAAFSRFTGGVLRADGVRVRVGQQRKCPHPHPYTVESHRYLLSMNRTT